MKLSKNYQLLLFLSCFLITACNEYSVIETNKDSPSDIKMVRDNQSIHYYDETHLYREQSRFEERINELFDQVIKPKLTSDERSRLRDVLFEFPVETRKDPIDFKSGERNGQLFVAMPVLSLLFLEDLFTAYAWLHINEYSLETIDEYITMLKYKRPSEFPNGYYPPPLEALQIPNNALDDKRVDELSLGFRNSAYAFILLHELGHIQLEHRGYEGIPRSKTRNNESQADEFALNVLERTVTIPMGAILFFQAQAYSLPSKGQLRAEFMGEGRIMTETDWQQYVNKELTHPLTSERLSDMALHLDYIANRNSYGQDSPFLRYLAQELINISDILTIEELQGCMAAVADKADLSTLAPRRLETKTTSLLERWCSK